MKEFDLKKYLAEGNDKLADKEKFGDNRYRVTKSGKMNKQDVDRMKNQYKRGY